MNEELAEFLRRNRACTGGIRRLENLSAETLADAWKWASSTDLVWAVTRPGVMSADQRRRFLAEAVLAPIEHLLTDERSKNILQKLRANSPIAEADAADAAEWAAYASWAPARATDASWTADAEAAAETAEREKQARWIRTNFKLADLRTN